MAAHDDVQMYAEELGESIGVGSAVLDGRQKDHEGVQLLRPRGKHVQMIDADDVSREKAEGLIRGYLRPGVWVLFESTAGNWHISSLHTYSWRTMLEEKSRVSMDDPFHFKATWRRGYAVQRITPKPGYEPPRPVSVHCTTDDLTRCTFSKPHIKVFEWMADDAGIAADIRNYKRLNTVNGNCIMTRYATWMPERSRIEDEMNV